MTIQEIADKLVNYCRKGDFEGAIKELYSPEAVSIEPAGGPWPEEARGLEAIAAKGQQFEEMVEEVHGMEISDPIVNGDFFTCAMTMDITYKGAPRSINREIAVYEVKDGKVVKEQFFYSMPG